MFVNVLLCVIRVGLIEGINNVLDDDSVSVIVIIFLLFIFLGGVDISEFFGGDLFFMLFEVLDKIENVFKLVVVVFFGLVFGGGFEVVLVCYYCIIFVDNKVGFLEVNLGILLGVGGI